MLQIILSTFLLSAVHATIPNHWIPLLAVGKAEKWNLGRTLSATVITGFAHTLSTILIGVIVGLAGYKLSENYSFVSEKIAPSILILLGAIYIIIDRSHHHHSHSHEHGVSSKGKISRSVLFTLSLSMFLTPCIEIEAYYFQAGKMGWAGIWTVSAVYTFTTVLFMAGLVGLGYQGIQRIRSHYLEHHEKLITGIVLVGLGILALMTSF
ncbi:MAG: hypothetical protein HXX13_13490 [Bacteroidetes bacterium]|nr:hypothetical protein [Bacteroidota bacterium]